jgi:DNA-binding XRE family transcriptional regulator
MDKKEQSQVATVATTQSEETKVKAYQKPFEHPKKPQTSQVRDPFSYPPSSRTYQAALLQKILNMPGKTKEEMLPVATAETTTQDVETTKEVAQPKRGRGRPPGAKNKPKSEVVASETAQDVDAPALARGRKPSLRKLRDKLGLNQSAMATQLGVTQAMVSFIESGKMKPSEELQNKITLIYRAN